MAEPTDPRIIDMMRQKARNERPLPKDFQELMEKTLEGDPASIRLVQESFSTEGMTAQEYASDWLGRNKSTPEQKVLGNLPLSDPSGMIVNPEKVEDEMTKILKSLLKASEQKAKEEKQ